MSSEPFCDDVSHNESAEGFYDSRAYPGIQHAEPNERHSILRTIKFLGVISFLLAFSIVCFAIPLRAHYHRWFSYLLFFPGALVFSYATIVYTMAFLLNWSFAKADNTLKLSRLAYENIFQIFADHFFEIFFKALKIIFRVAAVLAATTVIFVFCSDVFGSPPWATIIMMMLGAIIFLLIKITNTERR